MSTAAETFTNGAHGAHGANRGERRRTPEALLMLDKLALSGLNAEDAAIAQLEPLTADETLEITGCWHVPGFRIPYFNIDGTPLIDDSTGKPFFRLRLFHPESGFAAQKSDKKDKPPKYWQPKGTAPHLYLSPHLDWTRIAQGNGPLMEVEGELKELAAAKLGKHCIGLGGIWAWKSKSTGQYELLKEYNQFNLKGRDCKIIFDSDVKHRPQILGALHAHARALSNRGANPSTIMLPDGPGDEKVGLDDFLVAHGLDEFNKLPSEKFNEIEELHKLNTEFAILRKPSSIYSFKDDYLEQNTHKFKELTVANRSVVQHDSKGEPAPANAGHIWLKWPMRRTYSRLVYSPGQPLDLSTGERNLWTGFRWKSHPGDISNWLYYLDHVAKNKPDAERIWFERWCGWPIKHPGTKMLSAVLLYGKVQGSGKTLGGIILGGIYGGLGHGNNYILIDRTVLKGNFNDWIARRQFILADEITNRKDLRIDAEKLKGLITDPTVWVNGKYQPAYSLANLANFIFTSNHRDALFVTDEDRRYFIWHLPQKMDELRGKAIAYWATHEDMGPLRYHFENLDYGDFNPEGKALETVDRADVIDAGLSDLDHWAQALAADPHTFLRLGNAAYKPRDLYMLEELASACKIIRGSHVEPNALRNSLRKAGIYPTRSRVSTQRGRVTLWVVANADKWLSPTTSLDEIGAIYNVSLPEGAKF